MNKDILVPLSEIEINPSFNLFEDQVSKIIGNPQIPKMKNTLPIISNLSNFDVVFIFVAIISFFILKKYYRKFKFLVDEKDMPKIPTIIVISIGLGLIGSYAYIKYNLKNIIGTFV